MQLLDSWSHSISKSFIHITVTYPSLSLCFRWHDTCLVMGILTSELKRMVHPVLHTYILDFVGGGNRIEVAIPGPVPVPAVKARPSVESDMDASVSKSASSLRKSFPETWLWDLSYR